MQYNILYIYNIILYSNILYCIILYNIIPHLPGEGLLDFITAVPAPPPPPSPPPPRPPPSPPPPLPPLPRPLPPWPSLRQSLRQLPRAVGTAGPQLPASVLSGHGRTLTARF